MCGECAATPSGSFWGTQGIKSNVHDYTQNAVLLQKAVFTLWLMSFDLCEFGLIITQLTFPVSQSDKRCDFSYFNNSWLSEQTPKTGKNN